MPVRGLRLTPTAAVLRQGESDLRANAPQPDSVFAAQPALFVGVRETTYRVGLQGFYQPTRFGWIRWDVGQDFIRSVGHVTGQNRSRFVAIGEVGLRFDFPR